ncbi:hypothetical protein BD410DRAFT_844984 [Rickenella mellea]|uniref:Uncharacterized protein n=1 Tax=Rickenella mellea TaxID=50990 RepID=A0A4Y7PLJ4_9AGAM|nr:hypothetical protein BD410DRAFT_844984 [Rickenella mellea]
MTSENTANFLASGLGIGGITTHALRLPESLALSSRSISDANLPPRVVASQLSSLQTARIVTPFAAPPLPPPPPPPPLLPPPTTQSLPRLADREANCKLRAGG